MRKAANEHVDNLGYVQNVCGIPNFDRPYVAPEGQAFYLLMETACKKIWLRNEVTTCKGRFESPRSALASPSS